MDSFLPLAESSVFQNLTQPPTVFVVFAAVMAIGPMAVHAYFKNQTRSEELRTIAELARAGHTSEEIERIVHATKPNDD